MEVTGDRARCPSRFFSKIDELFPDVVEADCSTGRISMGTDGKFERTGDT